MTGYSFTIHIMLTLILKVNTLQKNYLERNQCFLGNDCVWNKNKLPLISLSFISDSTEYFFYQNTFKIKISSHNKYMYNHISFINPKCGISKMYLTHIYLYICIQTMTIIKMDNKIFGYLPFNSFGEEGGEGRRGGGWLYFFEWEDPNFEIFYF